MTSNIAVFSTSSSSSFSSPGIQTTDSSLTAAYLSVHIRCRRSIAETLSEALLCFGATSASVDVSDSIGAEDEIRIDSIFSISQDVKDCISCAADSIGLKEIPTYAVETRDHTDWIKETQESFSPVEVLEGLWIVPEWRKPPDLLATNIMLNPGLAFGTGDHPTTKMCLLLLRDSIKRGDFFLDYGTGTGILAIAALKFGAAYAVGLDIDPLAITSARQNAALNGIKASSFFDLVSDKGNSESTRSVGMHHSDNTRARSEMEKFDIVVANILLNPLLHLAEKIVSYAKPGAIVGLSGIISEQIPVIVEQYSKYLEGIKVSEMDGWACVSGLKKKDLNQLRDIGDNTQALEGSTQPLLQQGEICR